MKRAHIVYAHPESDSFVDAMFEITQAALERAGWETTVADLEAVGAGLAPNDPGPGLERRSAFQHECVPPESAYEVGATCLSDLLVLVFPLYSSSLPAQIESWIGRVIPPGEFYGDPHACDKSEMHGKRVLVVSAVGERGRKMGADTLHEELKGTLDHQLEGAFRRAGFVVYEPCLVEHTPDADEASWASPLMRLWHDLQNLEGRPTLAMRGPVQPDHPQRY